VNRPRGLVVAIDGPAGAGKSTVSKRAAQSLGYRLLDTGAIYRTVALLARRRDVSWDDADAVAEIAAGLEVDFRWEGDINRVLAFGEDVSEAIRTPEISQGASQVSALPPVRAALLELQQRLGREGGVVAEGRDIGTVVFPDAEAKFFLTATPEIRARRRYDELVAKGATVSFEDTLAEMVERDERDSKRDVAPLAQADDAVALDSSTMGVDQVVATIVETCRAKLGEG
jgi:cytidylate kinase